MNRKLILTVGLSLSLVACRESFIELAPISQASVATFYRTPADLLNALTGAYSALQSNGQYGQYYVVAEIPSDDTVPVLSGSVTDQDEFDKFYLRTTNPFLAQRWADGYQGIYRANAVIDRSAAIQMDETLKARIIGEAKFLRALMYFNLVRVYGDVPLVINEITDPQQGYQFGRNPATDVYAQIEKDLADAETVLPVSYTGANIGRATRGAVSALLGKVLLTQRKYPQAATKLQQVIDAGTYDLLVNYADVFRPANKNHRE